MALALVLVGVLFGGVCGVLAVLGGTGIIWGALAYVLGGSLGMMGAVACVLWRADPDEPTAIAVTSPATATP